MQAERLALATAWSVSVGWVPYGRQTALGVGCLKHATCGVNTGRATPIISINALFSGSSLQTLPEASMGSFLYPKKL